MDRKLLDPAFNYFLLRLGIVLGNDLVQVNFWPEQVTNLIPAIKDLSAVRPVKNAYEFSRQRIQFYRAHNA
jgi:hypothetical protein